jgi:heme/copper-type cytochrome/quinol oxidase subunit 1
MASSDYFSHDAAETVEHPHAGHLSDHAEHERELSWWRHYFFSTDHKIIGAQYLITGLIFLLIGFVFMLMMRWQLAYPGESLNAANFAAKTSHSLHCVIAAVAGHPMPEPPATIQAAAAPGVLLGWFNTHILHQPANSSILETFFGNTSMPGGVMAPDFYNSLGAMHGTIMVFLAIVPLGFAAFGNFVMPLQIGAPDMCFPRINMASYWAYVVGGLVMLASFFIPGGAAKSGWTSYSPLADFADPALPLKYVFPQDPAWFTSFAVTALTLVFLFYHFIVSYKKTGDIARQARTIFYKTCVIFLVIQTLLVVCNFALSQKEVEGHVAALFTGQSMWIIGMVFLITSSLLGAVNFIATIIQLRAQGMHWMRMPIFCWAQFITAFLLLLAFPPLEAAAIMQLMDRVAGSSFFLPTGLVVNGDLVNISGGGTPLLWQHLFWFLAHPEVYVLVLPGLSVVCEVITNNTRKPMWGYKSTVFALFVLGFLSFIVWAHHMYITNMGTAVSAFFQATTIIISIPSVVILTALLISLWGGSIRFTVPMMWACAFLPMFGIGGLTGIPLAFNAADLYLHDTYYIIAHFHYLVAPGTIFAIFAGIYHWFPKATGRMMNQFWGKVHFWPSFVLMNCIFAPMFLQGMAGMHRRWYDGGQSWELAKNILYWNQFISVAAFLLCIAQIPFIINFFWSIWNGEVAGDNPWDATTMEWSTPTPPPHGNFPKPPIADKGPYEYSVPGATRDFSPQNINPYNA